MTNSDPYTCDNCGEETHGPLIGGECVRKCSKSVPIGELERLADELIDSDYPTRKRDQYPYRTGVGRGKNRAGIEIKELISQYRGDDDE